MALQITRIKPNPPGKDRNRYGQTAAAQLAAEWVDFWNNRPTAIDLGPVELWHRAYHHGQNPTWEKVMTFSGKLQPGKTVRVHSGSGPDSVIRDEDRRGADHHLFTGRDYVWNNKEGDTPTLYNRGHRSHARFRELRSEPPKGEVLVRGGNKLVPTKTVSYSSYR